MRAIAVGLLLGVMPGTAFGQTAAFPDAPDESKKTEAPAAQTPTPAPAGTPTASPAASAAQPAATDTEAASSARFLYDAAFLALARGEQDEARRLLNRLRNLHKDDPLSAQAMELLNVLDAPDRQKAPLDEDSDDQRPTNAARSELIFFQTLHGIGLGIEACLILECQDARPWALSLMIGGGAGLGASLALSTDGVTPGLARSLTSGTEWGLWHGLMIGLWTGAYEGTSNDARAVATGLAIGQLAGLGTGGLLYMALRPTAGQVSLTSSGGIWTTLAVLATVAIADLQPSGNSVAGIALIASDVGLLAGAALASRTPMTAGRVLLIDAGGLVGALGGVGTALLIGGTEPNPQATAGLALAGTVSGLGLGWYLTRNWDSTETKPSVGYSFGVAPVRSGALATATFSF